MLTPPNSYPSHVSAELVDSAPTSPLRDSGRSHGQVHSVLAPVRSLPWLFLNFGPLLTPAPKQWAGMSGPTAQAFPIQVMTSQEHLPVTLDA